MLDVFFCFNYSATNEIDTYGHTRSLPDALPIYVRADGLEPPVLRRELVDPSAPVLVAEGGVTPLAVVRVLRHGPPAGRQATRVGPQPGAAAVRSEEHTSELQSLMRISYAVFCLTKKKYNNTTTTEADDTI